MADEERDGVRLTSLDSPLGDGLTAHVGEVALTATTLADPRDGS